MVKIAAFTLLEVLMVILIASVLAAIAVPYFKHAEQPVVHRVADTLQQHLALAKSLALQTGDTVMLCGSRTGKVCDDHWQAGYRIFSKKQNVNWLYHRLEHASLQIRWRGFLSRQYPQFSPQLALSGQNGSFEVCSSGERSRKLTISPAGRIRSISGKICT